MITPEDKVVGMATINAITSAVDDRDESRLREACTAYPRPFVYGAISGYYRNDPNAFNWIMFVMCHELGYEDFVCQFWVVNWQRICMGDTFDDAHPAQ